MCYKCQENLGNSSYPSVDHYKTYCGICTRTIGKNHRYILCKSCNSKAHIKCNKTDVKTYNKIIKEKHSVICIKCKVDNIPFQHLSDLEFSAVNKGLNTDTEALQEVSVTSTSLKSFFKEINKSNPFQHLS